MGEFPSVIGVSTGALPVPLAGQAVMVGGTFARPVDPGETVVTAVADGLAVTVGVSPVLGPNKSEPSGVSVRASARPAISSSEMASSARGKRLDRRFSGGGLLFAL